MLNIEFRLRRHFRLAEMEDVQKSYHNMLKHVKMIEPNELCREPNSNSNCSKSSDWQTYVQMHSEQKQNAEVT